MRKMKMRKTKMRTKMMKMMAMTGKNRIHKTRTQIVALKDLVSLKNLTNLNLNLKNLMNWKSLRHSGNSDRTLQAPCWLQSYVPLEEVPSS